MNGNKLARTMLILALLCLLSIFAYPGTAISGASQTRQRAGLVVQFSDGSYITRCISFTEDSINGLELLMRSGLHVVTWGGAVCRIEQDGCDYPTVPCFCQCSGAQCLYWSYWHWREGRWIYSQVGSADYQVHDGDLEGWAWSNGQPPPVVPVEQICAPGLPATTPIIPHTSEATEVATTNQPSAATGLNQDAILEQYAIFVFMAAILAAGFLFLRKRRWE